MRRIWRAVARMARLVRRLGWRRGLALGVLAALAVAARAVGPIVAGGVGGAVVVLTLVVWLARRTHRPLIADWKDAERHAAAWLRGAGCRGVHLTTVGADGGIDVLTREWAVQVKHRSSRTGRPAVQQIVGAALSVDRRPMVVSTSGFTGPAIDYADAHDVALVHLDPHGRATRVNATARTVGRRSVRNGIGSRF